MQAGIQRMLLATMMLMVVTFCLCTAQLVQAGGSLRSGTPAQQPPCNCSSSASFSRGRELGSRHGYHSVRAGSAAECCRLCAADDEGCAAFNFEPAERVGCFFQADALLCAGRNCTKPAVISGVVRRPSPQPAAGPATVSVGGVYHHTDPLFKCWNIDPSENRGWESRCVRCSPSEGKGLWVGRSGG
jgi:hypothetical protein